MIICFVVAIVCVSFLPHKKVALAPTGVIPESSIIGCYIGHLAKDIYTLHITSQHGDVVSGTLAFKNFEKDSSTGVFNGVFANGVLIGDYTFNSEGVSSVRQVAFKKVANGFVEGFGTVTSVGNREAFSDSTKITFDASPVFESSSGCAPL